MGLQAYAKWNYKYMTKLLTNLFEHWVPVRRSKTEATDCQSLAPKHATAEQSWESSSSVHSLFSMAGFKLLWNRAKHWNGVLLVPNDAAISNQFLMPISWTISKRDLSSSFVHAPWLIKGSSQFNHLWLQTIKIQWIISMEYIHS